jgi:hypothetical protein
MVERQHDNEVLQRTSKRDGTLGTTALRHFECGAITPWYLTSGYLGGATRAARRARNSIGVMTRWVRLRLAYLTQ